MYRFKSVLQGVYINNRVLSQLNRYKLKLSCPRHCSTLDRSISPDPEVRQVQILPTAALHQYQSPPLSSGQNNPLVDIQQKAFDSTWLRENCRCEVCFNRETEQRKIHFCSLTPDQLNVKEVKYVEGGQSVEVNWGDGHCSLYDIAWLMSHSYPGLRQHTRRQLWDGADLRKFDLQEVPFSQYMNEKDDMGLRRVLSDLVAYGVSIISEVPVSVDVFLELGKRMCIVQETLIGMVHRIRNDLDHADIGYTNKEVPLHTDAAYFSSPCGIQVCHCIQHDGEGGMTNLVDGFYAAEQLRDNNPDAFQLLASHRVPHEWRNRTQNHMRTLSSILQVHPVTSDLEMVRFNLYNRGPISTIPQEDLGEYYRAMAELHHYISLPENEFQMKLWPGTVLLFDNWRVLHGRSAFTGNRDLCGLNMSRDDWLSKARVFGLVD